MIPPSEKCELGKNGKKKAGYAYRRNCCAYCTPSHVPCLFRHLSLRVFLSWLSSLRRKRPHAKSGGRDAAHSTTFQNLLPNLNPVCGSQSLPLVTLLCGGSRKKGGKIPSLSFGVPISSQPSHSHKSLTAFKKLERLSTPPRLQVAFTNQSSHERKIVFYFGKSPFDVWQMKIARHT